MRYPMTSTACGTALLIAVRTCSSFGRTASGCAAMYSSTDLGTLCFIPLILCFSTRFFLADIRLALSLRQRSLPHLPALLLFIELCCMERGSIANFGRCRLIGWKDANHAGQSIQRTSLLWRGDPFGRAVVPTISPG